MAVARHSDDIEVQDEDQGDTNHENDTAVAGRRTIAKMSEEGHYESLDLQKIDEAVYGDLRTKAKKGKGLPKRSATNHKNDTAVTARRTIAKMSEEGHYESLDLQKIDEAVYGDLRTKTRKRKGPPKTRQSGLLRVVAWCLGILCLILLGVIIMGLVVHFTTDYKNLCETAATTTPPTTTVSDRKAVIKVAEMSEDMQRDAVQFATQALEKYNSNNSDIAVYIGEEFDKKYNPYWHCIVGRDHSGNIYHQANHYINFSMGQACGHAMKAHGWALVLYPVDDTAVEVYCDMDTDGGRWTVFQRRMDGSVSFYRRWDTYKSGFGHADGEYWLGLENLYYLTAWKRCELRVDMEDFSGNSAFAQYSSIYIDSEDYGYMLHLGRYEGGSAGDSLSYHHNEQRFSTLDRDQDGDSGHCARVYLGAFWYGPGCLGVNPNGLYRWGVDGTHPWSGVTWSGWKSYDYSLKSISMKIRPVAPREGEDEYTDE